MGLVAAGSPYNRRICETQASINTNTSWRLKIWIFLQAVLSAIRLYLSYALLAFIPLGDAVTILFVEPLFTLVFSFLFLRVSASIWKILLCFGLLLGMILTVQPTLVFGKVQVRISRPSYKIFLKSAVLFNNTITMKKKNGRKMC